MLVLVLLKLLCFQRLPNRRESIGKKLRAGKDVVSDCTNEIEEVSFAKVVVARLSCDFLPLDQEIFGARSGNSINWPKKV